MGQGKNSSNITRKKGTSQVHNEERVWKWEIKFKQSKGGKSKEKKIQRAKRKKKIKTERFFK
jgi:hypothetical protein